MGAQLIKLQRGKEARAKFEAINAKRDSYLIIHYSCESFYDIRDGRTPRITSIAVRNFASGQTHSFSIHKCAEQDGVATDDIPQNYDKLEKMMLDEYFEFMSGQGGFSFVHWNMRDINFGFQAIEHRYKVLGGAPYVVSDGRKFDLAKELITLYGVKYAPHGAQGRFMALMELNNITAKDAMNGAQEATAFENQQFVALHQSTLRKVDVMSNFLERTLDGSLKTYSKWYDRGMHPAALLEIVTKHWFWSLLAAAALILGFSRNILALFSN
jgi:hypothetical protein